MNESLPGVALESNYEGRLLAISSVDPIVFSHLPPGVTDSHVADSLVEEARKSHVYLKTIDVIAGQPVEEFVTCLGELFEVDDYEFLTSAYELVHANTDSFVFPLTVIVKFSGGNLVEPDHDIVEICNELVLLTKDLDGPLRFVLLLSSGGELPVGSMSCLDWEPLSPFPRPLRFAGSPGGLVIDGYDIYVSLRFFWEAAGCPELLSRCHEYHSTTRGYIERKNTDELLSKMLEREFPLNALRCKIIQDVFEGLLTNDEKVRVLKSGTLELTRNPCVQTLKSSGLFWHPPGRFHLYVTVDAARSLCSSNLFRNQYAEHMNIPESLIEISRVNPLISSWLYGLLSLIELELLSAVKVSGRAVNIADHLGFTDEFKRLARVNQRSSELGNVSCMEPIDFAGFHHLVEIATHPDLRGCVPLSRERLNDVRIVRNMVAHANPVSWQAVKIVLNSLEALCRK